MKVIVAGAGFAGLLAAWRTAQAGHDTDRRSAGSAARQFSSAVAR